MIGYIAAGYTYILCLGYTIIAIIFTVHILTVTSPIFFIIYLCGSILIASSLVAALNSTSCRLIYTLQSEGMLICSCGLFLTIYDVYRKQNKNPLSVKYQYILAACLVGCLEVIYIIYLFFI